jgi:hypothetical protein
VAGVYTATATAHLLFFLRCLFADITGFLSPNTLVFLCKRKKKSYFFA